MFGKKNGRGFEPRPLFLKEAPLQPYVFGEARSRLHPPAFSPSQPKTTDNSGARPNPHWRLPEAQQQRQRS